MRVEMAISLQCCEGQPDSVLVVRCDTWPVVLHDDRDHDDGYWVLVAGVGGLRGRCHVDITVLRWKLDGVGQQVHEYLLQAIFVTDDPMVDQASVVLCERHFSIHVLELDELDDLIEHILHDKVVIFLRNLAILQQSQVH